MSDLQLVLGDKHRSPRSLSAWLMLKQLGLEFEEVTIPLGREDTAERLRAFSPGGELPVLVAGEIRVWEILAIAEFLADHFPALWPEPAADRALARSISAETQGGLRELQVFLPFDLSASFTPLGRLLAPVAAQVARVVAIWTECRTRFRAQGPFLLGPFTVADAMFAPLCAQLTTHSIPLEEPCQAYVAHMLGLPAMLEWVEGAQAELGTAPPAAPAEPMPAVPMPAVEPEPPLDEEEEDDAMPAPGLPGVVPTQPYAGAEEETEAGPARRLLRPPGAGGLFRWRQPQRLAEQVGGEPPPRQPLRAPAAPVEPPPRPAVERPPAVERASTPAPPPPSEPPARPAPPSRPTPEMPPPVRPPLSVPPAYAARLRTGPTPPAPSPEPPAPPPRAVVTPPPRAVVTPPPPATPPPYQPPRRPEAAPPTPPVPAQAPAPPPPPAADELPPDFPGSLRPIRRSETIKPIGDGIRRRR